MLRMLTQPIGSWEWSLYGVVLLALSVLATHTALVWIWLLLLRIYLALRGGEILAAANPWSMILNRLVSISLIYCGASTLGLLLQQAQVAWSGWGLLVCAAGALLSLYKLSSRSA